MTESNESTEGRTSFSHTGWFPGETIKPDGQVRMPEGIVITVIRSDMPNADELDPTTEALIRRFTPPNPEALARLTKAAGIVGPGSEAY